MTVVDPRHPLYGRTFPLLHVKNTRELIPSCLVQLAAGVERLIPLQATNLVAGAPDGFSMPLALSSLHKLTKTFARIQAQMERGRGDEETSSSPPGDDKGNASAGLGNADAKTAEDGYANGGAHLPGADGTVVAGEKP